MKGKPIWSLEGSDLKNYLITSSVSLPIMISVLSLFECIALLFSMCLEGIKLIAVNNWVFYVLDF